MRVRYLLVLLMLVAVPVLAQDFPEPDTRLTVDDTYSFLYPEGWFVDVFQDSAVISNVEVDVLDLEDVPEDEFVLLVLGPQTAAQSTGLTATADLETLAQQFGDQFLAESAEGEAAISEIEFETTESGDGLAYATLESPTETGTDFGAFAIVVGEQDLIVMTLIAGSEALRDAVVPTFVAMARSVEFIIDPNRPVLSLDWTVTASVDIGSGMTTPQVAAAEDGFYIISREALYWIAYDGETVQEVLRGEAGSLGLVDVALLPDGSLFVFGDLGGREMRIWHVSAEGEILEEIATLQALLDVDFFVQMFAASDGTVYVFGHVDPNAGSTVYTTLTPGGEAGEVREFPLTIRGEMWIAEGPDDRFYTLDFLNLLTIFDEEWEPIETIEINRPGFGAGFTVLSDGRILVGGMSLTIYAEDGTLLGEFAPAQVTGGTITDFNIAALAPTPDGDVVAYNGRAMDGEAVMFRINIE